MRPAAVMLSLVLVLSACGDNSGGSAGSAAREIAVTTSDELRFEPMTISAQAGERVVLVVSNPGRLDHELVIGTPAYLDAHAEGGDHGGSDGHADGGASVATAAGKTVRLTFTMPDGEPPSYACFVDRHDKAGMTGTVTYT